eukprot:201798_1
MMHMTDSLSRDVCLYLLSFLSIDDLPKVAQVNHSLCERVRERWSQAVGIRMNWNADEALVVFAIRCLSELSQIDLRVSLSVACQLFILSQFEASLKNIRADSVDITENVFKAIFNLPQLRSLSIESCRNSVPRLLLHLPPCLASLSLLHVSMTDSDMKVVTESCPRLATLAFGRLHDSGGTTVVVDISCVGLRCLGNLNALKCLSVMLLDTDDPILPSISECCQRITRLRYCQSNDSKKDPPGLAYILPNLSYLAVDVYASSYVREMCVPTGAHSQLRRVELRGDLSECGTDIADAAISSIFRSCHLIEEIRLADSQLPISDLAVSCLTGTGGKSCTQLRVFECCSENLTDIGCRALVLACPNIEDLTIKYAQATRDTAEMLHKLASLRRLDVSYSGLADPESIGCILEGCRRLNRLDCMSDENGCLLIAEDILEQFRHVDIWTSHGVRGISWDRFSDVKPWRVDILFE